VHATAEPVQTLDTGWDVAAIGEGEATLLNLVDAGGDPDRHTRTRLSQRSWRCRQDRTGRAIATGHVPRCLVRWQKFSALGITCGCAYACQYKSELLLHWMDGLRLCYIT
jgi:radical SAM superfamily enzyme YgiQ (UPF0313 family)